MKVFYGKDKKQITERGQALLLVLLSMAVILTVVLSVASKSVTDVSITTSGEDALRAFSAAEAGIESALLTGKSSNGADVGIGGSDSGVSYNSEILSNPEGTSFTYPSLLKPGETATLWFVGRDINGNYSCADNGCMYNVPQIHDLCWGLYPSYSPSSKKPAISITVYYDPTFKVVNYADFSGVKTSTLAYDGYSTTDNARGNGFKGYKSGAKCNIDGKQYAFHTGSIKFGSPGFEILPSCSNNPGCLLMAKVRVYYNDPAKPELVALDFPGGTSGLPAQGNMIVSTGTAGDSTRKVNVFQSFSEAPSLFDAAVFSLSDFSK
jgi:hypothetical protein